MVKYSLIIPTLNEEENIAKILQNIPKSVAKDAEIIVVDRSTDATPRIAAKLGAKVIRPTKPGKGFAIKFGAKASRGEILVFLDGDGEHPPEYIPQLISKLNSDNLVLGTWSLHSGGKPNYARILIYNFCFKNFFEHAGLHIKGDALTGFRAIRKKNWQKLNLKTDDFRIETEMNIRAARLGLKICEVPIPNVTRQGGLLKSKLTASPLQWLKLVKYLQSFNL